jgi:hypothetical protein
MSEGKVAVSQHCPAMLDLIRAFAEANVIAVQCGAWTSGMTGWNLQPERKLGPLPAQQTPS